MSQKLNIKLWIEAGTLLGLERNSNFIPWEKDIDFGSWNYDLRIKSTIYLKKFYKTENI